MSLIYTSPTASRNNIYLGGKADAKSFPTLKQRNILRVLNVTPAKEAGITAGVPNYFEHNKGGISIKYKRISVYDASTSDLLSYAEEVVNFISSGLHHGSVLVHCQRGVSRSATAVMFYLIRKANMTYQQALQLCKERRATVDPIPAFCDQLKRYEQECRELGYLTATDVQHRNLNTTKGQNKDSSIIQTADTDIVGSKRQVEASGDRAPKRRMGPSIGPSKPSVGTIGIGPSIGPSRPNGIGPSIGPSIPQNNGSKPSKKTVIGPQIMPPVDEEQVGKESNKSEMTK